jgi:hypothetical protein
VRDDGSVMLPLGLVQGHRINQVLRAGDGAGSRTCRISTG